MPSVLPGQLSSGNNSCNNSSSNSSNNRNNNSVWNKTQAALKPSAHYKTQCRTSTSVAAVSPAAVACLAVAPQQAALWHAASYPASQPAIQPTSQPAKRGSSQRLPHVVLFIFLYNERSSSLEPAAVPCRAPVSVATCATVAGNSLCSALLLLCPLAPSSTPSFAYN